MYPFLFRSSLQRDARRQVQYLFSCLRMRRMNWWWGDLCWLKQAPVYDSLLLSLALCAHLPQRISMCKGKDKRKVYMNTFLFHLETSLSRTTSTSFIFVIVVFIFLLLFLFLVFRCMIKLIYLKSKIFCLFTQWERGANPKCKGMEILIADICNHWGCAFLFLFILFHLGSPVFVFFQCHFPS